MSRAGSRDDRRIASRVRRDGEGGGGGKAFGVRRHSEHGERGRQGRERERITYPIRIPPVDVGPGTEGALHTLEVIILRGIPQLPEQIRTAVVGDVVAKIHEFYQDKD